ncbi:MFS transporter [Effusibacillus lacus]|uniref:MFS transporter n=1 Tax=Effusibacillus lacus TaxID=1348429 RepID=A0A292YPU7_9BACL|nr:MFS transporter [Effusibacillus lacus]
MAWGLDGFDGNIFSLVIGSAMKDLLVNSGIEPTEKAIAFYGGMNITIYLIGWSLGALLFGILADYFGRVRVLMVSILVYALFTFACAFVDNWYTLAVFRFLTGLGSGVEWPIGAALIAESWNNRFRAKAAGIMMSGFAFGFFLSSFAFKYSQQISQLFGFEQSWRGMFLLGILPAFIVVFTRGKIHEPESFKKVKELRKALKNKRIEEISESDKRYKRFVLVQLFKPPYRRDSLLSIGMSIGGLFAFWAITGFTPSTIREILAAQGINGAAAVPLIANGSMMLYLGGMIGYASWGFIADKIGRKKGMALSFITTIIGTSYLYPFVKDYETFLLLLPVVGFGVFSFFSASAIYFAELFNTEVRTTAISLANNVGRFITSPGPFIVGTLYGWFGSYGVATAIVSSTVAFSLILLYFAKETWKQNSLESNTTSISG